MIKTATDSLLRKQKARPLPVAALLLSASTFSFAALPTQVRAQAITNQSTRFAQGDYKVSPKPLNLSRVPTEAELRAAGGDGGPLCPIDNATPEKVAPLLAAKGANAKIIAVQTERLKAINHDFGMAVTALQKHDFKRAVALYQNHLKEYPDSPWAAEIMLHLGQFAASEGRYSEAEERYAAILEVVSDNPADPAYDMAQKTKVVWAGLDISLGKWNAAQEKLGNILRTERGWRRTDWAQAYLQKIAVSRQSRQLVACGSEALAVILADTGHAKAAAKVQTLQAPREAGFSLAELGILAKKNGVEMRGVRANVEQLSSMPMPLLVHYDFNATAAKKAAEKPHCERCVDTTQKVVSRIRIARRAHALLAAFQLRDEAKAGGHFLIVRQVDAKKRQVLVFNPGEEIHPPVLRSVRQRMVRQQPHADKATPGPERRRRATRRYAT